MSGRTFVHDVPGIALPFVVGDQAGDVVLHGCQQSLVGPCSTSDYNMNMSKETRISFEQNDRTNPSQVTGYARRDCDIGVSGRWLQQARQWHLPEQR